MTRRPLHLPITAVLLAMLVTLPTLALARGSIYTLDPVHTRVLFSISHDDFSDALGTISGSTGKVTFDPEDWSSARVDVSIPVTALDLGDDKWNSAALAGNLLDGEHHPQAHFVSSRVERTGENQADVTGQLTLHGVTRDVVLHVTLNAIKRRPFPPFRRAIGFSAHATLHRSDFGVDGWKSMIGDEVQLRIEAEGERSGKADDTDDGSPTSEESASEISSTDQDSTP